MVGTGPKNLRDFSMYAYAESIIDDYRIYFNLRLCFFQGYIYIATD